MMGELRTFLKLSLMIMHVSLKIHLGVEGKHISYRLCTMWVTRMALARVPNTDGDLSRDGT